MPSDLFKNDRFCGIPFDTLDLINFFQIDLNGIISENRVIFGDTGFIIKILLNTNMSPKTEDLVTDYLLKSIYKAHGNDHDGNTDACGTNSQTDNEPGEGFLPVKSYTSCYEERYIQTSYFWYITNVF